MSEISFNTNTCIETKKYLWKKRCQLGLTTVSELKCKYQRYFGSVCVKKFVKNIIALEEEMRISFRRNIKIKMSEEDQENFKNAKERLKVRATCFY